MAKPYVALAHFHPALLRTDPPGDETYAHDDEATYLVIQPFIFTNDDHPERIGLTDYFQNWDAQKLHASGVGIIGEDEGRQIQERKIHAVPVPLPPDTKLSLRLKGNAGNGATFDWHDERVITGASAGGPGADEYLLGDGADGWPGFAVLSSAQPLVTEFADLDGGAADGPQKTAVFRTLLGHFSELVRIYAGGSAPAADAPGQLWTTLVAQNYKDHPLNGDGPALAWWLNLLNQPHASGRRNIEWAYELLVRAQAAQPYGDPYRFSVPRFHWADRALETQGDLFLAQDGATLGARSYLHALWHTIGGLAQGSPKQVDEVEKMLGRLLCFGERLAWPLARFPAGVVGSKRFMPLRLQLPKQAEAPGWLHPEHWFATNAPSLLGLVFRISPFDTATTLSTAEFSVGAAQAVDPLRLADSMNRYFGALTGALATAPVAVRAGWGTERGFQTALPAAADRIVMFAPREAPLGPIAVSAVPAGRTIHSVPEALLDIVDDQARFTGAAPGLLPGTGEPRRGLFLHEVLPHAGLVDPATARWYRLAVTLSARALSGVAANAFAISQRNTLHNAEKMLVEQWLVRLPAGGAPAASLWIPQASAGGDSTAGFPLSVANVMRDADGSLLVLDPDPEQAGSLTKLLTASPGLPGGADGPGDKPALPYLVFASEGAGAPFDLVEFGASPQDVNIVLALAPVSRLSMSSDRIAHPLAVTWSPGFAPDGSRADGAPTPKVDHGADANKLRMRLDGPENLRRRLTDPDALLPLPPHPFRFDPRPWNRHGPVSAAGPQAGYWLAEHFDQDQPDAEGEGEETRFQAWVRAGQPFALAGYVEHQFGHRVWLAGTPQPDLRRSVDIALPTDVNVGTRGESSGADHVGIGLPFVVVHESGGQLHVSLDTGPVTLALDVYGQAAKAAGTSGAAERDPVAGVRALYRALAELRDAMADAGATLVIESWRFDNASLVGRDNAARRRSPTLAAGLVLDHVETIPLRPDTAGVPLLRLLAALDRDFQYFVTTLRAALAASAGTELALLGSLPIAPFGEHGSYVRAGLHLRRPEAVRAVRDWVAGAFIPVFDTDVDPRAGAGLADTAQRELQAYLTDADSRAVSAFGWAVPADPADPALAGPGAQQFLRPSGPTAPVERVLDLFYMPHAFLLPRAHPALGDRQATFEFANFLLGLVNDILAGHNINDRIGFMPHVTLQGAGAMRRALREMLERSGGVADALMALFVPVDVPADDPPSQGQELHWHAARLVAALERVDPPSERPRHAVRQLLVEQPDLYARARAIAIAPFNTETDLSTGVFNHSTFSNELFEFTLTKTLVQDDDERRADETRFSVADLRGETRGGVTRAYVLDVLPEDKYDDTVLIPSTIYHGIAADDEAQFGLPRNLASIKSPGAAKARRGEDVVEPGHGEGIAVNVVHIFPNWRRRDSDGLTCKYLLPERRMPPRPRPVDPCLAGQPGARAGHSAVTPAIHGLLPRVDLRAQWNGAGGQLGAYDRAIGLLGAVDIAAAERDDPRKAYLRIGPAAAQGEVALESLPQAHSDLPEHIEGWHTLTAELSHFWFEMDLDKPQGKLVENLDDNAYEVEVEMWSGRPPAPTAAPEPPVAGPSQDWLLDAFRTWRAGRTGKASGAVPLINPAKFAGLVEQWLLAPPAQAPWNGQALLEKAGSGTAVASAEEPAWRRTFRIRRVEAGGWTITEITVPKVPASVGGLGAVVGFEILGRPRPDGSAPRYDDPLPIGRLSALVRISVLDHPLHVSRARMRVLRNWQDVDGDNVPDINPELILAERYSDWGSELRQPVVLGPSTPNWDVLQPVSRELHVVPAGMTRRQRIEQWLARSLVPGQPIDFGFALKAALEAPAFIDASDHNAVKGLWPAGWMSDNDFRVGAVVRRTLPDTSFRHGEGLAVTRIPERDVDAPRQILAPVPAPDLHQLLDRVQPAEIVALDHFIVLSWRDREGVEVLRVQWPVVFQSSP